MWFHRSHDQHFLDIDTAHVWRLILPKAFFIVYLIVRFAKQNIFMSDWPPFKTVVSPIYYKYDGQSKLKSAGKITRRIVQITGCSPWCMVVMIAIDHPTAPSRLFGCRCLPYNINVIVYLNFHLIVTFDRLY